MLLDECIKERRSCKSYLEKEVPMELIYEILEAATYAPSAGNLQNWYFLVVTDIAKREAISKLCLEQMWMLQAPVHIIVCNRKQRVTQMYPKRGEMYGTQACAAAIQNMLLKAHDVGLASCWVGAFNQDSIANLLKLPQGVDAEAIVTIGYPVRRDTTSPGRDRVEVVSFFNEYGKRELKDIPQQKPAQAQTTPVENTTVVQSNMQLTQEKKGFFSKLFGR